MVDKIPIIDLEDLGMHNPDDSKIPRSTYERVAKELDEAFANIGFAYVRNHGIKDEWVDKVVKTTETFFHLPHEEKVKYKNTEEKMFKHGYNYPGMEYLQQDTNLQELREVFNFGEPDGPFPESEVPELKPSVLNLVGNGLKLLYRLYRTLAIGLGLDDEEFFCKNHESFLTRSSGSMMRVLYYPPMAQDAPEGTIRLGEHSDYGTITLLMQDTEGGLEVKNVDGNWVPATPIPDCIIINVGELLTVWSDGRYPATPHRVKAPIPVRRGNIRRSIAVFGFPNLDSEIRPLFGEHEDFKSINSLEYMMKRFHETYL